MHGLLFVVPCDCTIVTYQLRSIGSAHLVMSDVGFLASLKTSLSVEIHEVLLLGAFAWLSTSEFVIKLLILTPGG